MRAFVQTAIGEHEERDLPAPRAGPGEVVLRVRAALTCGTDLKLLARGHPRISLPVTMGHEACGEIVEVGEGVADFRAGDRVVPAVSGPCGACADCLDGRANLCATGHADRTWGAFAELLRVPPTPPWTARATRGSGNCCPYSCAPAVASSSSAAARPAPP